MHLITGYAGKAHITAADQGAFNAAVVSAGKVVLPTGEKFRAEKINNGLIKIHSGDALINGRHANMPRGESESVAIDACGNGLQRKDIIAIRYEKNMDTLVESAKLAVLKGTTVINNAEYPRYADGSVLDGESVCDLPLYGVWVAGEEIREIKQLFRQTENVAQMNEVVSQISETMDTLADISQEDVEFTADTTHIWGYVTGMDSHLARMETEADGGNAKSAKITVKPGETYRITADRGYYTEIGGGCPLIATVWAMTDGGLTDSFGIMRDTYYPLKNTSNVYLVTVPANCTHLLVNSCSDTLEIKQVKSNNATGGAVTLWRGAFYEQYSCVDFFVPAKYWHDGCLTLLIDCVRTNASNTEQFPHSKTVMVSLSRFHTLYVKNGSENIYSAYYGGNEISYGSAYERFSEKPGGFGDIIDITATVEPLTTTDYARVKVTKNDNCQYVVTSIYAIITKEG